MMNFELFEGLSAYFCKTVPSSIIKIWQLYGGETIFVPAYKKPDIWFGMSKKVIKKKNSLHERWIYDSILANKQISFGDYYIMNQSRFLKYELSRSKKLKKEKIQKALDRKKKSFQKSNRVALANDSDNNLSQYDSNIKPHNDILPFKHTQSTSFNYTSISKNISDSITSTSLKNKSYSSSIANQRIDLLPTSYQNIGNYIFNKSLFRKSFLKTKKKSTVSSSFKTSKSPIKKIKILTLNDFNSTANIFEIVATKKINDTSRSVHPRLK
ncbi:hypothetical protein T552_01021 [Pneumocystis carinii B80]|uniref:BRCT domain-containing protein n=1 Tax=Pneumocystis carinii (strain B80) TaxID=1408658 RepID=A0A0W4ZN62_PNEC8|nr:hypothetical protein T552_01021 [Pneumocystis carinii B80]KTW29816.1 hypothetical protein T552_01021 [Pneumocystis carinii B80]